MNITNTGPIIDNTSRLQGQMTVSHKVENLIQETKEKHPELSRQRMEKIVEGMNEFITPVNVSIRFELHDKLKEFFVKVVDTATDEVIREIPSKKFLDMYAAMTEYMGLFVDKKI
ncbi:flagellar protein FlaG [Bacillus tianshenii]|uniref:Flagellar protein FlaG n=1 Tax=Sutcliffiella tianshenii TaxID=1463404 RepID=A0ABS2NUM3_9BACI|nr:flagellar protein FlaG [Bacillus tianshenii]MBM7618359.1 flagellar protein FlaG [Bacillus tianshenii]